MPKQPRQYRNLRLAGESQPERKLIHMPGAPRNVMMRVPVDEPDQPAKPEPIVVPSWLDAAAADIYRQKSAQIQHAGYWRDLFEDSLALLASLLAEYRRAPAKMPSAKVTQMRLLLSELGLTPQSSRGVTPRR